MTTLALLMDPIAAIKPQKDSSLAMALAAQARGWTIQYLEMVDDPNVSVIFETLTKHGRQYAMAQRYIPEISTGDKRILLVDGEPIPYARARVPAKGETRGNLAVGGTGVGVGVELSKYDRWVCAQVAPRLKTLRLMFVGLDIGGQLMNAIAHKLRA